MRVVVNWAASCGGCDVSLLDCGEVVLSLAENAEVLYWPVALDFKQNDLKALEDKSVDFGIVNGAIRTSEQEEEAKIIRKKCKVLVAYGSCACSGGIPGLANQFDRDSILRRAYVETADQEGQDVIPKPEVEMEGYRLTLPEFYDDVKPLDMVVEVDYYVPGCPPSSSTIEELANSLSNPPEKKIFASDKSLCHECPRNQTKEPRKVPKINRPHELRADERCLLEQGELCLGFATRGGCGARCINVNMPCRGCYGKLPAMADAGDAISTIASIAGEWEDYIPTAKIFEALSSVKDPVGLFYQFSLPSSLISKFSGDKE